MGREATPPAYEAAREAAEGILARRSARGVEKAYISSFPGVDDLLGVVAYVQSSREVKPDTILRDDDLAALTILAYLAGEVERRQFVSIQQARERAPWALIARALNLLGRQSAVNRMKRLRNHRAGGTRDERADTAEVQQTAADNAAGSALAALAARVIYELDPADVPNDEDLRYYLEELEGTIDDPASTGAALVAACRLVVKAYRPYPLPPVVAALATALPPVTPAQRAR